MTVHDGNALSTEEQRTLEGLLAKLDGPGAELPWPLFRFINEVVATVNIDLLVQDDVHGVLLAWRDDPFGKGWHVPGSIIRHREEISHRIQACARDEFGCDLTVADRATAVVQIFDDRGHSVSLCYRAMLREPLGRRLVNATDQLEAGDLCWFRITPSNLYPSHRVYRDVLASLDQGRLDAGAEIFTQHVGIRDAEALAPEGSISSNTTLR